MAEERKNEGSAGGGAATAVRPPPAKKRAPKKSPPKLLPLWKVLLHNDDVNNIGYVIVTILQLTPLDEEKAVKCTEEADKTGVSLLLVTHKERAELYRDQFQSKGLTVTIEPAD